MSNSFSICDVSCWCRCWVTTAHQTERILTLYLFAAAMYIGMMYYTLVHFLLSRHMASFPVPPHVVAAAGALRSLSVATVVVLSFWCVVGGLVVLRFSKVSLSLVR